ncbi:hypothetical protein EHN07_19045 [Buttiauxella warmboldiae]|uniref:Uncharacterized protein n=1 Tax=Buttiauxella warmboldiae TaxID=82993 RepID=A0A3N5DW99_9ENTR|nr:hypothetical protein [Buttiauxella warmboldiae]RPH20918.1 hypothetical protein EHN07_19045 [Buttiauxella warmboldiae]
MKVHSILALSLAATSFSCLAFKSQVDITHDAAAVNASTLESKILANFYSQHGTNPQNTLLSTCDALPVAGCSCPFCIMLRSRIS